MDDSTCLDSYINLYDMKREERKITEKTERCRNGVNERITCTVRKGHARDVWQFSMTLLVVSQCFLPLFLSRHGYTGGEQLFYYYVYLCYSLCHSIGRSTDRRAWDVIFFVCFSFFRTIDFFCKRSIHRNGGNGIIKRTFMPGKIRNNSVYSSVDFFSQNLNVIL